MTDRVTRWFNLPDRDRDAIQILVRPTPEDQAPPAGVREWLSEDERQRAERYSRDADRWRFVEARALLRLALGQRLDSTPGDIKFATTKYGKPVLGDMGLTSGIGFSVSHTPGLVVLAIADDAGAIGVDVERFARQPSALAIARSRFRTEESDALARLPVPEQAKAFLRLWVRKEALHKAIGQGLSLPLDRFDVRLDDHGDWSVTDLVLPCGYLGALAFSAVAGTRPIKTYLVESGG